MDADSPSLLPALLHPGAGIWLGAGPGKSWPSLLLNPPITLEPPNSRGTQGVLHPGATTEMPTPIQALQLNHMEFIHTLK